MANLREETLNTYLALLLDQYDGISAIAENRSGQQAIDITVTHESATDAIPIFMEAKIGDSPSHRRSAARQARSRLHTEPRALAWGICYPAHLRDGSISAQATQKALAESKMVFAPVPRLDSNITWRAVGIGLRLRAVRGKRRPRLPRPRGLCLWRPTPAQLAAAQGVRL